ncbi:unnamed protein product [Paramecium pentaurelia]|uniref:Uncharacterized protein n=1 Tax=Paramecium pentaurelia TaxID=43138 RepID=A0A8S1UUX8_9CILI|nr:unnamed protein product [Paramecium pentaurelia]
MVLVFHVQINWGNLKKVVNIKIVKIKYALMEKKVMMKMMQIEMVVLIVRLIFNDTCSNEILKQSIFFNVQLIGYNAN